MKVELTDPSRTSTHKIQTPGKQAPPPKKKKYTTFRKLRNFEIKKK